MIMRHDPIDPSQDTDIEGTVFSAPPARVADRMSQPVVTIGWEEPVARACRLMEEKRIRHLAVVDRDRHLVGIVTDGDLGETLAAAQISDPSTAPPSLIVGQAMTWDTVTVAPSCELREAVRVMHARKLSALPVVKDGDVVGILTDHDILGAFVDTIERR